ncbi:hypothetical protein SAMN05444955_11778 [Lihuaxuella thermophila]|uniref:Uncharacterized protein n=1 Tax=Lihuaxuella thermophila TaxID=1173111 RepID=A0A1H8IIT9_9BACL|nr:hypothetical protein SAMN05444955_11778 [Lihuaxuella thermophila]
MALSFITHFVIPRDRLNVYSKTLVLLDEMTTTVLPQEHDPFGSKLPLKNMHPIGSF